MAAWGLALGIPIVCLANPALAQEQQVYGSQLMTQEERDELQARMRAAPSEEEREQIREEHHLKMQEHAKERGVTLPDEPPVAGMRQRPRDGGEGKLRLQRGIQFFQYVVTSPHRYPPQRRSSPAHLTDAS